MGLILPGKLLWGWRGGGSRKNRLGDCEEMGVDGLKALWESAYPNIANGYKGRIQLFRYTWGFRLFPDNLERKCKAPWMGGGGGGAAPHYTPPIRHKLPPDTPLPLTNPLPAGAILRAARGGRTAAPAIRRGG